MKKARVFIAIGLFIAIALLLVSCRAGKEVSKTETRQDSVFVKVETRVEWKHDTIVETIREEVVSELVGKDSSSTLEDEYSVSYAEIVDGLLFHSLKTKNREIEHPIFTPIYYKDSVRVEYVYRDVFVEIPKEREKTKWERICYAGFPFLLFIILISIFLALKKFFGKN